MHDFSAPRDQRADPGVNAAVDIGLHDRPDEFQASSAHSDSFRLLDGVGQVPLLYGYRFLSKASHSCSEIWCAQALRSRRSYADLAELTATPSPLLWGKVPSKARRMRGIERSGMALIGQHDRVR